MSGEAALVPFLGAINQVTHPTPQPRTTKRAFSFRESLLIVSFAVSEAMPCELPSSRAGRGGDGGGAGGDGGGGGTVYQKHLRGGMVAGLLA